MSDANRFEYVIVGAGPAGLQLGYFLAQAGHSFVILERGAGAGTFFETFPRHRKLISINKVHTGYDDPEVALRWDWNSLLGDEEVPLFKRFSRDYFPSAGLMVDYLREYARHYALPIASGADVTRIERQDAEFVIQARDGRVWRAARLVVATGVSRAYLPPIPGIDACDTYVDVSVDPQEFANQRVLILGKGNSALETADNLIATAAVIHVASPRPVKLAWKTHHVGHLRAINNNFLDTYQLKSQNAVLDCDVRHITRREDGKYLVSVKYTHADEEAENLEYDRVIACTGFAFDASLFAPSCRPALAINERFPDQSSAWESTNVPGLYFAGTLMQMRDFKKYTSGFIHGFRYNVRSLQRILASRYHGQAWPSREVPVSELSDALLQRVNRSSGLWQQFSMLGDLIVLDGARARYHEELPLDYFRDGSFGAHAHCLTVNLEFGHSDEDPFSVTRHPDPTRAHESFFLHPVVRRFVDGRQVAEHHVIEDLSGEWKREQLHVAPLRAFLRGELLALGAQAQAAATA